MNEESKQLHKEVQAAERPFAKKGFEARLSELYPQLEASACKAVATVLTEQIYARSARTKEDFIAVCATNGLVETEYPVLDNMVQDMTTAFFGLGSDILELGPESIRWS